MATILVVEDRPTDRQLLVTLLGYGGHRLLEAVDGVEALHRVRAERPDLVIADLLLPRMDGFEFVRQVRADSAVASTPVIFYTATYDDCEARALAAACGVSLVLPKPSDPQVILRAVAAALNHAAPAVPPPSPEFDREHLRVVNEKLYQKAADLTALLEAGQQLNAERDLGRLLDRFCQLARDLLGAEFVAVGLLDVTGGGLRHFASRGPGATAAPAPRPPDARAGVLGKLLAEGRPCRLRGLRGLPGELGLPERHPPIHSFLGVPVTSPWRTYGWLYLVDRGGADEFSADDEQLAVTLAAQLSVAYENASRYEELLGADRRKDEFLAMLAHELRNPLAPIRNANQVLRLVGLAEPNIAWATEVIERQVQQLTRLVDDLLDISRITCGKVKLRKEPVELVAVLGRAVETCRPLIDGRRHALTVALPPQPVRLEADATRLAQVVSNLLNNAAKYTEEGGQIVLGAERVGAEAVIRVRDNGAGMTPETLAHAFDLFAQADRSLDRSEGGLGIGLTLVKSLVELHGGTVEGFSDGVGRGSEFTVRLPVLPEAAPGEVRQEAVPARTTEGPARLVLIVDDNVDATESLAVLLRLSGHDVRTVYDGQAALQAARDSAPEVILLDIGLPGMNGYEVARQLRATPAGSHALLVALTGYGQEDDRRRSREAGFDRHLVKPVASEVLHELLRSPLTAEG